ncbi:hypothetical protein HDU83_009402 [Entophlyctis luteolus]|nr:hypothetical protein HDU83_009402 [Entophlyctis luteolus]
MDEKNSTLDPDCGLSALLSLKVTSKLPLLIKSKKDNQLSLGNSGQELCSIHPEWDRNGIVVDKADGDVYILTNLHLLGTDKAILRHVSADFKKEVARYKKTHPGHMGKKRKRLDQSSSDPIKIKLEQFSGSVVLESVVDFVLEHSRCWAASASFDFMIFQVPIPDTCTLEKCVLGIGDYQPALPVHIFGFPGILVSDEQFEHNYAVITAEMTGKDDKGHMILSALSTPGLSGSAIICTGRGYPIGYLAGGFDTSETEQFQCYGYGLEFIPKDLPRFLPHAN